MKPDVERLFTVSVEFSSTVVSSYFVYWQSLIIKLLLGYKGFFVIMWWIYLPMSVRF